MIRWDSVSVSLVTTAIDSTGSQTFTKTGTAKLGAQVFDVHSSLVISERYRSYQDLTNFKIRYTPFMRTVVNSQENYCITYRNQDFRITDVFEDSSRQFVTLLCYANKPGTAL